jgi:hypothetical protein
MLRIIGRGLLLLALAGGVLGGVVWMGRQALEQLRGQDRYTIPLSDVQCEPPAGMDRVDFIDEVQYLAGLPAELHVLDDNMPRRLAAAFARHPWVEKVEQVQVMAGNTVRVRLRYRTPVLAVPWNGTLRAVDAGAVLLPADAATDGLPIYQGIPLPPHGPAGTCWNDPDLLAAAQLLAK